MLQQRGHDVQTSNMKENIWLLHNKTAFDECDVSKGQVTPKTDRFTCAYPTRLVFLSLLFLEHAAGMNDRTFVGGRTYYLIGKEKYLHSMPCIVMNCILYTCMIFGDHCRLA